MLVRLEVCLNAIRVLGGVLVQGESGPQNCEETMTECVKILFTDGDLKLTKAP